jgi:integrase
MLCTAPITRWSGPRRGCCMASSQGRPPLHDPGAVQEQNPPESERRCCAIGKRCQRFPSPARVRHVFKTLRATLGVAVAEEIMTRNVASFAKPTRPRRYRFNTWSVAEAATFLAAIREHRLYALFAVAIALGMRRGEALGLAAGDRWTDSGPVFTHGQGRAHQSSHATSTAHSIRSSPRSAYPGSGS